MDDVEMAMKVKEASKLTKREIKWINDTCDRIFTKEGHRVLAIMALCSHIVGCLVFTSKVKKSTILSLIGKGVEI